MRTLESNIEPLAHEIPFSLFLGANEALWSTQGRRYQSFRHSAECDCTTELE